MNSKLFFLAAFVLNFSLPALAGTSHFQPKVSDCQVTRIGEVKKVLDTTHNEQIEVRTPLVGLSFNGQTPILFVNIYLQVYRENTLNKGFRPFTILQTDRYDQSGLRILRYPSLSSPGPSPNSPPVVDIAHWGQAYSFEVTDESPMKRLVANVTCVFNWVE